MVDRKILADYSILECGKKDECKGISPSRNNGLLPFGCAICEPRKQYIMKKFNLIR